LIIFPPALLETGKGAPVIPTVLFRVVVVPVTDVGRIGGEYEVMVDVPKPPVWVGEI